MIVFAPSPREAAPAQIHRYNSKATINLNIEYKFKFNTNYVN